MGLQPHIRREIARKSLHVPIFLVPLLQMHSKPLAYLGLLLFMLTYGLSTYLYRVRSIDLPLLAKLTRFVVRKDHFDPSPFFLGLGLLFTVFFSNTWVETGFASSILVFSDSAAALFGMQYGTRKVPFSNKSFVGCFAFFCSTLLISLVFFPLLQALYVSGILTFIELLSAFAIDNFSLPLVALYLFKELRR